MTENELNLSNKTLFSPTIVDLKVNKINETEIPHAKKLLVESDIGEKVQQFGKNLDAINYARLNKPGYIKTDGNGYISVDQSRFINSNEDVQWVHGHLKVLSEDGIRTLVAAGWPEANTPVENGLFRVGRALNFKDVNILGNFCGEIDSYSQVIIQNKTNGNKSSADIVFCNDLGSAEKNYSNIGINSSSYIGDTPFDEPNGTYIYSDGGSITLGSSTANDLNLVTNNQVRLTVDGESGDIQIMEKLNGLSRDDFSILKDIIQEFLSKKE